MLENPRIKGTPAFFSYSIRSELNEAKLTGHVPEFQQNQEKSDVMSLAITVIDMCLLKVVSRINDLDTYLEVQK